MGCAQAHIHTGPSWPVRFATSVCCSPDTSKILMVRSDEHVATRCERETEGAGEEKESRQRLS